MGEVVGEMVSLKGNGSSGRGYVAAPEVGTGPALLVLPDGYGLTEHTTTVCDRFAGEGFVALAHDLDAPPHPDLDRPPEDLVAAMVALKTVTRHPAMRGDGAGVVGFGAGGALALIVAAHQPSVIHACVVFDVAPSTARSQIDGPALAPAVELHVAVPTDASDGGDDAAGERPGLDADLAVHRYDGVRPGFFDETRPEAYDAEAASVAWTRTLSFLRAHLG